MRKKDQSIEYIIIKWSIIACIIATILYLIVHLVSHRGYRSNALELVTLSIFITIYFLHSKVSLLVSKNLFAGTLLLLITYIFMYDGGIDIPNTGAFLIALSITMLISSRKNRIVYLIMYTLLLIAFTYLDYYNYTNFNRTYDFSQRNVIYNLLTSLISAGVLSMIIIFIKDNFEKERAIIQEKNNEIKAQNKILIQQQEQISKQKDLIEQKLEELEAANTSIAEINTDLSWRIEDRTEKLNILNNELDQLFYRSSHDLRRPITTLKGLYQIANITLSDKDALEIFDKMDQTATGMERMVDKFLMIHDVSKFEMNGNEGVEFDELEITIKNLISDDDIELKIEFQTQEYPSNDPRNQLLSLILINLTENSLSYNNSDHKKVHIKVKEVGSELIISVEDNGQGIPEELIRRVYEMYFRGNLASSGNGLGLYVVKKAVDKLKGNIEITSEVNKFTKVTVTFPFR